MPENPGAWANRRLSILLLREAPPAPARLDLLELIVPESPPSVKFTTARPDYWGQCRPISLSYVESVTDQRNTRIPQFFLTPGGHRLYLPGRVERKVFARLAGNLGLSLVRSATHSGFRRSQSIAYRPACEGCNACSLGAGGGRDCPGRNLKRTPETQRATHPQEVAAEATREQFALLRTYLIPAIPAAA